MKNKIIVVEGKNDYSKIKQIYPDINIMITNGFAVSEELLIQLKQLSKDNEIILLLDPDYPGEYIRKRIMEVVPNATHIFVNKKDAISKNKRKVGVEHVSNDLLKEYLQNYHFANFNNNFNFNDLFFMCLIGDVDSKKKREFLCNSLNIGYVNGKQLVNRLNLFNIKKDQVIKILEEYNDRKSKENK